MSKIEEAPVSEEVTKVEETTEETSQEDRIDAIEKVVLTQGEQIADIAEEQEKIVDILEKISDKLNSEKAEEKIETAEETIENEIEEKVENDISEESSEKETEGEEPEVVENIEVKEDNEDCSVEATVEGEEVTLKPADEETKEEVEETQTEEVENSITEDSKSEESEEETEKEDAEQKEPQEIKENKMTKEELQEILNSFKAEVVNEILDAKVEEPKVEETEAEEKNEPEVEKNWRKRYNEQIACAWNAYRLHNIDAAQKLAKINKFNFEEKKNKIENGSNIEVMTIETADDFVLPYEVDNMIHGKRTNYSAILNAVEYQTTDRLTFAWATREGDIDMQNVALCNDGEDGNLKPISTYELKKGVAQMEELAAVTPICDNATKYLAVDILSDVAAGYRNDYDRKLAQLVIVRMQQAINKTGNSVVLEGTTSIEKLVEIIKATTKVSDDVVNGTLVFNAKTKAQLVEYLFSASAEGELGKDTMTTGEFPTIFGYPYIVVPNDLMPTLGEGDVKSFKAMNNETGNIDTVTINSPVFYGDLDEFRGKVSGGLKYDVSAEAAYEAADGTVKSAWQRNELILRGSFLRGGYIANQGAFSGLTPASN